MPLVCSVCGQNRPGLEFSKLQRQEGAWRHCLECRSKGSALPQHVIVHETERVCAACNITKSIDEFPFCGNERWNGRRTLCDPCYKASLADGRLARKLALTEVTCRVCNLTKPIGEFSPMGKGRFEKRCKECNAIRARMGRLHDSTKYAQAKGTAKQRKIAFTLTREEFDELRTHPCVYCGGELPNSGGTGLDRIDNDLGYIPGNVLPSCWWCNQTRNDLFTIEEMKLLGKVIAEIKAARIARGEPLVGTRGWGRPRKYD